MKIELTSPSFKFHEFYGLHFFREKCNLNYYYFLFTGKKKNKKKKKKKNRPEEWARQAAEAEKRRQEAAEDAARNETEPDVEVEYIQEKLDLDMTDPMHRQFSRIFEAFKIKDEDDEKKKDTNLPDYGIHNEELKKVPKEMLVIIICLHCFIISVFY